MTKHYETLGLKPTATQEEIKKAYGKLSQKFHPDINNGDEYFSEMFKNFREAYEALSDEYQKTDYDIENHINDVTTSADEPKDISPKILNFESDKDSFVEGDTIVLKWNTRNADKIIVKPFGELEISGTRIFKLKNFNKPELLITLKATNSLSKESSTKTIKLKNKVTDFDFSQMEDMSQEFTEEIKVAEGKTDPERETIPYNSFVETAPITNNESHINEEKESFLSVSGRLRRSTYIGRAILLSIPGVFLSIIAEDSYDDSLLGFAGIVLIISGILIFMQFVKRLHDINLSGWWGLINLIPYIGIVFGLIVIFIDGTKGFNLYGPDPKNR